MNRFRTLSGLAAAALLVVAFALPTSAQVAMRVSGKVTLRQPDGSVVPLQGATVKIHRVDIKQELQEVKTDKNGNWVHAGVPIIGTYTLLFSAPGARPHYVARVRFSQRPEGNDVELEPGDGSVLTLDQVKEIESKGGTAAMAAAAAPATAANTEEAKRKAAALEAERARVEAENAKATEINTKLPEIMKAGNAAYTAKNYDEAIARYNEGLALDPNQHGFLSNKAIALQARGADRYNAAYKSKDEAGKQAAREDLKQSVEAAEKAVSVYRTQPKGGAAAPAGGQSQNLELSYLSVRAESYRLAFLTLAPIDNEAAAKAIEEYVNAETDANKKNKSQALLGEALFLAGKIDESVAKFREILAANPGNVEAMRGLGISLAAKGDADPSQLTEAVKTLEQFLSKAPQDHPRRPEVATMAEELKGSIKELANKPQPQQQDRRNTRRRP